MLLGEIGVGFYKGITIRELKGIIAELPEDWIVVANAVANITFLNPEKEYVGHIDLLNGTLDRL